MARMDPILKHAITAPVFGRGKLHRERLVDVLHANIPRKVVVIAAPAGYGKTTLLADFTTHTELPVVWVRLTEADRDLMRLASVLAASLERRFRRLRGLLDLEALAGSRPTGLARMFAEVMESNIDEPFVIVFDDVHLINRSKRATEFMDALLEVLPEQATLMIAGREVPEVSLAKLMAEGDLAGLGPHDLALDEVELRDLARQRFDIDLDNDEAARLFEETRGWVTGVLLSGKLSGGLLGDWHQASRPMVYEYLASVVLQRQPDEIRHFLLDTAIMPILTAEACDAVFGRQDSDRVLRRVLNQGLFITATGESPRTYEYHPQFREFLLDIAKGSDEKRMRRLAKLAASYLAKQGHIEQAVELYLESGNTKQAAKQAEQNVRALYIAGHVETLERWASQFNAVGEAGPQLYLYLGILYSNQGLQDRADVAVQRAMALATPQTSATVRSHIEVVRALVAFARGEYKGALSAIESAKQLMPSRAPRWLKAMCTRIEANSIASWKEDYSTAEALIREAVRLLEGGTDELDLAIALIDLSNCQSALGRSVEAHVTSQRVHQLLESIGAPLPLGISFNNLAVTAHMEGRYEDAFQLFRQALKCARLAGALAREAVVLNGQADLFNDLGLSLQAAELYGQALTLATRLESKQLIRYGCMQTAVLHRRRGGNTLALEWIKRAIEQSDTGEPNPGETIQMARLEMKASPAQSRNRLLELMDRIGGRLAAEDRTLCLQFAARAAMMEGEIQAAEEMMRQALDCAGANGTEQLLVAEFRFDAEAYAFAARRLQGNAVLSVISQRLEVLEGLASSYREPGQARDSSVELAMVGLGQSEVRKDGQPITELTPFSRELLFYLVDHQRVERDTLIETFWPDHLPGRQTSNLHTAVYNVRRAIGKDIIASDGSAYQIDPGYSIAYDVARFERVAAVAEGLPPGDPRKLFALTEAINSYSGPFLMEYASDWVLERRRALEMKYLDLAVSYADEALLRDQPLRAVNTLRQALKIDPYRDDLNLRILEALGRLGRRSEVVSHYQRYVRLLADELGLDPPYAVRDAYARLIG